MEPQELATKCLSYIRNRDGTELSEHSYTYTDDAPDWFGNLVRECHFGLLPNDWSYRFVRKALSLCAECNAEDGPQVDLDSEYPYTADRLQWFASALGRPQWCDDHFDEFGRHGDYGHNGGVLDAVSSGMWMELDAVAREVWAELVSQCKSQEAAEVE